MPGRLGWLRRRAAVVAVAMVAAMAAAGAPVAVVAAVVVEAVVAVLTVAELPCVSMVPRCWAVLVAAAAVGPLALVAGPL
jgi:hypothetical protein